MRTRNIILFSIFICCNFLSKAQIQQNINKPFGTVANPITDIDSIRFNNAGTEMQLVLLGGATEVHNIIEIDSVTFSNSVSTSITAHSCGADSVHNPNLSYGSMTDQQGNVYRTIIIDTQEWMAENLKTSIYRNGDAITNVTDSLQWEGLSAGAWCYYNNDNQYECPYGKLYNWFAVVDVRNICPLGWHVPNEIEWQLLNNTIAATGVPDGELKSSGFEYWQSPNFGASNQSGFSGLPGGARYYYGVFEFIGYLGAWWSSTESDGLNAWLKVLSYVDESQDGAGGKGSGASIRCLRD